MKKKIKVNLYLKPIFETGDVVAIQLKTADKHYIESSCFSEEYFRECNGKYVVMRKVTDRISYTSQIEPAVKDYWAIFQFYSKVFDVVPTLEQLENVTWADPYKKYRNRSWFNQSVPVNGLFVCESSMFYFKKRKYVIIGKNTADIPNVSDNFNDTPSLFLGINHTARNTDTDFLNAISDENF